MSFMREFWGFMRVRKKFWLMPIFVMMFLFGGLVVLTQGSAVALGTLLALSRIKFPRAVDCWLAVTENRIGSTAYKSRDVVTASNGTRDNRLV